MMPAFCAKPPSGKATQLLGGNDNGTRRLSDPRQRSAHDGARRSLGALSRRAASGEPAAVLRRAAAAAGAERGGQGQRRHDHGHGGAGSGDPGARHAAGRDRVQPRAAPPQPRAASAFPGGAGARLRCGLDPDGDGHRGDRRRRHVRHARAADPVPRRSRAGLRRGAGARLQQLGRRLLQDRPDSGSNSPRRSRCTTCQLAVEEARRCVTRTGRGRGHRHAEPGQRPASARRGLSSRYGMRSKSSTCRSAFIRPATPR